MLLVARLSTVSVTVEPDESAVVELAVAEPFPRRSSPRPLSAAELRL